MNELRNMRRKRQQLPEEETIYLLRHATSGVLSLLDESGYPYGVPISYVYDDNKLYFHSALNGHKIDRYAILTKPHSLLYARTRYILKHSPLTSAA